MTKKTASSVLSERRLRELFENEQGKMAMIGADRLGKGGRPSGPYFKWLEDIVRTWWRPELSAMIARENKRTIAQHDMRQKQNTIFDTEKHT